MKEMPVSIVDYKWTSMSAGQAAVARYLANCNGWYIKRPMGRRLAEDSGLSESSQHVATGVLRNLYDAELLEARFSSGGRSWHAVRLDGLARQYIKANPYLGMMAREAIEEYLKLNGPVLNTSSASACISAGTGYNPTTISHELHQLVREGVAVVTQSSGSNGRYILGVKLPGQEGDTHEWPEVELDPLRWLAARQAPMAQQLELDDTDDDEADTPPTTSVYARPPIEQESEVSAYETLAEALLAIVIEKAGAPARCEDCAELEHVKERLNRYSSDNTTLNSELRKVRTKYNELHGRYNSLRAKHDALEERLRNPERRISRYPIDDDKKAALAKLMRELPRG